MVGERKKGREEGDGARTGEVRSREGKEERDGEIRRWGDGEGETEEGMER